MNLYLPQYDAEMFIQNVKLRCSVPTSQLTFKDSDFVKIATNELQDEVVPLMMSTREEFFVGHYQIPTPVNAIVPLPDFTVASKVRSVCYVQQSSPIVLVNLPRIDLDVVAGAGFWNFATLAGFYVEGDNLVLYPSTSVPTGTLLRIYYYRRTLDIAAPTEYGRVVAMNAETNTLTLDYVPANWIVGMSLNSVLSFMPFNTTNEEIKITNISSPTIEVDTVEGISVGDYISLKGYSAIPQIPIEAHGYLAQLVAIKTLEGLGDREGMQTAQAKADLLKQNLLTMISQRVDGSPKKVMNPTGGFRVQAGMGRWGRGMW